jgi:hypothetical protein
VTIVNYASSGVNKLKASINDDARVIIYNRHMFIVQATAQPPPYFVSKEANAQSYYTVMVSTCVVSPKVANPSIGTVTVSDNLLIKMPNVSQMM